jgi:flavin-dependent dehydrogenase
VHRAFAADALLSFKAWKWNGLDRFEVAVVGGGIAGMAASIHLARAGMRVVCVEVDAATNNTVGESLDWSAPDLLAALGLPMQQLLDEGIATRKRHIILKLGDGTEQHYIPGEWLGTPPYNVQLGTLHVDRVLLNSAIRGIMLECGVQAMVAKVARVETTGRRIKALHTADGDSIEARWYIDASGAKACLLPRHFQLPFVEYGPHKVAIWDYFRVSSMVEGTTLHVFNGVDSYMEWIWQIPIHEDVVSVGYIASGESIRDQRRNGESVQEIYARQLERFSGLRQLAKEQPAAATRTTSFRCRVCRKVAGVNWIVIGEAAAMIDPMTANGVTAALRQASEAAALILRYRHGAKIGPLDARVYAWRVASLACFFNCSIEKVVYEWPVRARIGIVRAGDVYTIPAWLMNLIYSRLRPRGAIKTALYASALLALRAAFNALSWYCRQTASPGTVCAI